MKEVVLVDENDKQVGLIDSVEAHLGDGVLHRAFTALVFNNKGETLICQRSAEKMLWPLFWDNTCASHPIENEGYVDAGERRLVEELGFSCKLSVVEKFRYQEKYKNVGSENELCTILTGEYSGEVHPVQNEVADYKWISIKNLKTDIAKNPDIYTVWFKIALDRLIELGRIKLED
ncbi:MAG: isopentenyl-diphosphate Delta-isomerase [Candidatus Saccharibacteria bacterium]